MTHSHPALPYAFAALEPYIDAQTMQFHHEKHHGTAVDNLNKAIAGTDAQHKTLGELLANTASYTTSVRNSAGSHYNHSQFWEILAPAGMEPSAEFVAEINEAFGSLDGLKEKMNATGAARFGSGWAWLIVKDGKLRVTSTPNQDNPLMDIAEVKGIPVIGIDVWEHAYYLKYQNRRPEYLSNIWNVINWSEAEKRYKAAISDTASLV